MENTEIAIIETALETIKCGSEILENNKVRSDKGVSAAVKLLAEIAANDSKMTAELDEKCLALINRANTAEKEMNEARKPITQAMTIIAKEFTGAENLLKADNKDSKFFQIQLYRNQWAKDCALERKRLDDLAELERQRNQEAINIKAECERRLIAHCNGYAFKRCQDLNNLFNAITLDSYDEKAAFITNLQPAYAYAHFTDFKHSITSKWFTVEQVDNMLIATITGKFEDMAAAYKAQLCEQRDSLIDRLPSKKKELISIKEFEEEQEKMRIENERLKKEQETADAARKMEIEKEQAENKRIADEAEALRLQALREAKEREDKIAADLKLEQERQQAEQHQAIDNAASVNSTLNLFQAETAKAEIAIDAPETRTGYEIEVLGHIGYMHIFQLWFENEGIGMTLEELGKKLGFMKTACENLAQKKGLMIESDNIKYHEKYTAVNRKAKK